MGGIRAQTVRLENLLFGASGGREAEKVDRLLQVASGDHHIGRSQSVQTSGRLAHLVEIGDRHPGQDTGFVKVRRDHLRQRNQPLDQKPRPRRIQQISSGTRLQDRIQHHMRQPGPLQKIGNHLDHLLVSQHADVDGFDGNV